MLDFENSFFIQHWEFVLIFTSIAYFILRLRDSRRSSEATRQVNDEDTIANDDVGNEIGADDDLLPSLENVDHVPFKGASVVLKGGVEEFYNMAKDRRSVRMFSRKPVDIEIVKQCILAAGTAPSGAHTEPWTFCLVKRWIINMLRNWVWCNWVRFSDEMKMKIREIIEAEEYTNYQQRMSKQWTTDLKPLRTNHIKEYLTEVPYIILVFKQTFGVKTNGERKVHYYNEISCAISVGILLCALQSAGLSSLTTTPLNCGPALRALLNRPQNEKLMVALPVGYPSDDCEIPNLARKELDEIMEIYWKWLRIRKFLRREILIEFAMAASFNSIRIKLEKSSKSLSLALSVVVVEKWSLINNFRCSRYEKK